MPRPVLVFGATGFTGRLVVASLQALGVADVILGGRDRSKLEVLSRETGLPFRVGNAEHPETLPELVRGCHVVVSTAGPFVRYGQPLVHAAVEARAHFLDTTGEQAFLVRIQRAYDAVATERRLAIVDAQAFEFALGYCVAALLTAHDAAIDTVDVFNRVQGAAATHGTQRSALLALQQIPLERRDRALVSRGISPIPRRVRFPDGAGRDELAVPFPGGEALFLPTVAPAVRNVSTNLVLPDGVALAAMAAYALRPGLSLLGRFGALAPLEARIDRSPEGPSAAHRATQHFKVLARGRGRALGAGVERTVLATGVDPYGITGTIAALGAKMLVDGAPRAVGVVSTDQAFGAETFLGALAPWGVRVTRS